MSFIVRQKELKKCLGNMDIIEKSIRSALTEINNISENKVYLNISLSNINHSIWKI